MGLFNLEHLPANRGWRWKVVSDDNWEGPSGPFVLDSGETQVIHELDIEGENVLMGWIVYSSVTSTSAQIEFESITEKTGSEGFRRAGEFKAQTLLNGGATEARTGLPWAEKTTVNGQSFYTIWVNAFGGFAIPVRYPEFSRIEIKNPSDNPITVSGFNTASLLVHKPELFFRQLIAFNALQGTVPPERVTEMDSETMDELISMLTDSPV